MQVVYSPTLLNPLKKFVRKCRFLVKNLPPVYNYISPNWALIQKPCIRAENTYRCMIEVSFQSYLKLKFLPASLKWLLRQCHSCLYFHLQIIEKSCPRSQLKDPNSNKEVPLEERVRQMFFRVGKTENDCLSSAEFLNTARYEPLVLRPLIRCWWRSTWLGMNPNLTPVIYQ